MARIAIYVSDEHEDPDNQLPQLRAWCAAGVHSVTEVFVDHGIAADLARREPARRPRFSGLYKQVPLRQFDCVLAWSMAEFFREGLEGMLYTLQQLENADVSFHSYTEPGLSSDKGLLVVITALAAQERAWRSEQTRIGMQRARERGSQIGRQRISAATEARIRAALAPGDQGMGRIARKFGVAVGTVHRIAHEAKAAPVRDPVWR